MLSEALRLPYRAADSTGTLLVGAGLTGLTGIAIAGWLAVLLFFPVAGAAATPAVFLFTLVVRGYLLRVVAAGITETTEAPSFVRWGSLLRTGIKSAVVSGVYALPGVALGGLTAGAAVLILLSPPGFGRIPAAIAAAAIVVGGFGLLWYAFVYLYLRGAARAMLAATGSLRSALGVRRVLGVAWSGSYLGGWLVAMGMLLLVPVVVVPALVISVGAAYVDAALTLIGVLATGVLGVVLWFSVRMSAAWATGNGAAPELPTAGSLAISDGTTLAVPPAAAGDTALPDRKPEAPPGVQTGRSVTRSSESGGETTTTTDGDGTEIEFGMPEPTPPEGPRSTASEPDPDADATDDPGDSTGDEKMTLDESNTYRRSRSTAEPAAADEPAVADEPAAADEPPADDESPATDDAASTAESENTDDKDTVEPKDSNDEDTFKWGVTEDE
ncbi:MAG: DUF4013 domain-containing protein [Halonotius sp.]